MSYMFCVLTSNLGLISHTHSTYTIVLSHGYYSSTTGSMIIPAPHRHDVAIFIQKIFADLSILNRVKIN